MPSFNSANFLRLPQAIKVDPIYRQKMLENGNRSKFFIETFYPMKTVDVSNICQDSTNVDSTNIDSTNVQESFSNVEHSDNVSSYIKNVKEMSVDFLKSFGLTFGLKK